MSEENYATDSSEESEIVGPGKLLALARENKGLSMQQVADKLNFRLALVQEIEQDKYDRSLPPTFNRGYLKNYAKLVNVSESEVLESYEKLSNSDDKGSNLHNVAMQSFSKQTEKQAENNRLMWVSYLILAVLIGSTLMWWLQDGKLNVISLTDENTDKATEVSTNTPLAEEELETDILTADPSLIETKDNTESVVDEMDVLATTEDTQDNVQSDNTIETTLATTSSETPSDEALAALVVDVSFTFLGDCWVNIYDATGERIAWGIKKAEYEMNISGQPPFSITLGKPELVSIVYDGSSVDMTQFNRGNIAKFTLPLE
ncbi:RodZ domain-containing protein [Thalassotalea piscium]